MSKLTTTKGDCPNVSIHPNPRATKRQRAAKARELFMAAKNKAGKFNPDATSRVKPTKDA